MLMLAAMAVADASVHPAYVGRTGDAELIARLNEPWLHDPLLAQGEILNVLGSALAAGTITGYDLRPRDVYRGFASGRTFIYSQSSRLHLQQLATLMAAHEIPANIYLTPKVSAFLYRDGWGAPDDRVATLPGGARVIYGREVAVLFEFDEPAARSRFHALVQRYAKRDADDEAGLIANAWWQPFYYTDEPLQDFVEIALVVIRSGETEATLTVTRDRVQTVVAALEPSKLPLQVERVWVNPAFHRFLNGDYR